MAISFHCQFAIALAVVGGLHAETNRFSGWPDGWKSSYEQFENYLSIQETTAEKTGMRISRSGIFTTTIPGYINTYYNGHIFRQTDAKYDHSGNPTTRTSFSLGDTEFQQTQIPTGTFCSVLEAGEFGQMHNVYPFMWFENREGPERTDIRTAPPPKPPEDFWPNERLFHFMDFNNQKDPNIRFRNAIVIPTIKLRYTDHGEIQRTSLAPALERLLTWRIYHKGKLISNSALSKSTSVLMIQTGAYISVIGIEGPSGFMPVSNMLMFALFPKDTKHLTAFPNAPAPLRFPSFLIDLIPKDQINEVMRNESATPRPDLVYNPRSFIIMFPVGPFVSKEKADLFLLWQGTGAELNAVMKVDVLGNITITDHNFIVGKDSPNRILEKANKD